jgi:hypothetical protein
VTTRHLVPLACAALVLGLTACGGGDDDGGSTLALGDEAVVVHTTAPGLPEEATTTLGVTVLAVRMGTQEQLKQAGFTLDPEEQSATPYYVDTRFENQGSQAVGKPLLVSLEDQDGERIGSTTIIDFGGAPFEQCPKAEDGELAPGQSYEGCLLFLVPEGREPAKVSFLPYDPENPTEYVYWDAAG